VSGLRSGKFLLVLASTVILRSESLGTHDHIFMFHDSGRRAAMLHETSCGFHPAPFMLGM
jgi:hypothetical protein